MYVAVDSKHCLSYGFADTVRSLSVGSNNHVFVAEVTLSAPCRRALKAVVAIETAVSEIDLISSTGNFNIITWVHLKI